MKIRSVLFLVIVLLSCDTNKKFDFENADYKRITAPDVDSAKGHNIEYVAVDDTNWSVRKSYYPNGQLWGYAYSYKGKDTGLSKGFYENGSIRFVINHKRGEFDTGWYYNEAGKLWYLRIREPQTGYYRDSSVLVEPWENPQLPNQEGNIP